MRAPPQPSDVAAATDMADEAPPAAATNWARANVPLLALLTLTHLVVDTYATTVPALLPFWQARFALTYGLAGLITGISNVTSSVAQPIVGILTDRGRDPRWIILACLVAATGISLTGIAPSYAVFLAFVVLGGLGISGFHPQGYKITGLHAGKSQAAATSWFLVGGNVGVALGPLLGTALALRFGTAGTLGMFPLGAALAAALWFLLPRWAGRPVRLRFDGAAAQAPPEAAVPEIVLGLTARRRLASVAVLVAAVAARSTVSNSLASFVPLYYVRYAGTGEGFASRVLAGMLLTGAVATIAGGYLADRWGRLRVVAVTLLPVPPLLLVFVAVPAQGWIAIAALWIAGALVTASFSVTVVLAQELWYERRALASGVIVGFAFGVGGLFVPGVGAVADRWGLPQAFRLIAALPAISLVLVGLLALLLYQRPRLLSR